MTWQILLGIGILLACIVLYVVTYIINEKTKRPEGCEEDIECSACNSINCSHRKL